MSVWESLVLGLVQGLTEFLPVSSSGHLVIGQTLFGLAGSHLAFDVFVHGATLLATVLYFRGRLFSFLTATGRSYIGKLALGTLPAAVVGLTLREAIEAAFLSPLLVAGFLGLTGALLLSLYVRERQMEGEAWAQGSQEPSWGAALLIGCAQAAAILPGVSRSGSTIVAAIWLGVAPAAAAEFSFLLGIPAVAGAIVLLSPELGSALASSSGPELVAGALVAFVSGLGAIFLVFRLLERRGFRRIGFYCLILAAAFAAWLLATG